MLWFDPISSRLIHSLTESLKRNELVTWVNDAGDLLDLRFIAIGLKGTPFILLIPTHFCLLNISTAVLHTLLLQAGVSPVATQLSLGCFKHRPRKKGYSTVVANNHRSMNHGRTKSQNSLRPITNAPNALWSLESYKHGLRIRPRLLLTLTLGTWP